MNNHDTRISALTREQLDTLVRRLQGKKAALGASGAADGNANRKRQFCRERDCNFRLDIAKPGIIDSLRYRVCAKEAPPPGCVEVEVRSASLNFRDVMLALGLYPNAFNASLQMGSDCAGTVVAIGENVSAVEIGDEVMCMTQGGFSAYALANAEAVMRKPPGLTWEQAAGIPVVFLTAYYGLHYLGRLSRGERVLVHCATGGLGLAALQVAKLAEAEVFATAGTEQKRAYLRSIGIQRVMDSRSLAFADELLEITKGDGVDVILNCLPGEAIKKGLEILRPYGRFIEVGKRDLAENHDLGLLPFLKGISFSAVEFGFMREVCPELLKRLCSEVQAYFDNGTFKPLPSRVYSLSEASKAFAHMAEGKHIGKIVLAVQDEPILVEPA